MAKRDLLSSNKEKNTAVNLGTRKPMVDQHMLGADWPEGSLSRKDLGLQVHTKLTLSRQCTLTIKKSRSIRGYTRKTTATRSREVLLPLCSVLMRHILSAGAPIPGGHWAKQN